MTQQKYLSVSALTKYIKTKFEKDPYLDHVFLTGEISNFRLRPKHQYFSLKDEKTVIGATMWAKIFAKLKFQLEEGMKVLVIGRISVYEPSGSYSIIIEHMEPGGIGSLFKAFHQLQEKLNKEGLFKPEYKQAIPRFPKRIVVLTSSSGSVIRDIITTVHRRYPIAQVVLFPTIVQGKESVTSIVTNIKWAEELGNFNTMIIGRGGGSIEDLWSFNEERVVRAIFEAKTPIISSVGHETDLTLADLTSDMRAATPTAAAELATPVLTDLLLQLQQKKQFLSAYILNLLKQKKERLVHVQKSYIFNQPYRLYEKNSIQLDQMTQRLIMLFKERLKDKQTHLFEFYSALKEKSPEKQLILAKQELTFQRQALKKAMKNFLQVQKIKMKNIMQTLDLLSPLKIMSRGFAYTTNTEHIVVKSVKTLQENEKLLLHYIDGIAKVKVLETTGKLLEKLTISDHPST
ncbi:MAG: exodeoxyribonuclease VII large subunit [Streptococcaceae bacterium]|nr:exodeoxyribonuclease VII large subunit [Streptococcaceae bacterium]